MVAILWVLISILVLLILFGVFFVLLVKRKKLPKREPDYFIWFILGICGVGAGISLGTTSNNWGIFIMGIIFMIMGLAHKKDWKKNHVRYKDLTPMEKRVKIWTILIMGFLILAGLIAFFIFEIFN